ncbi:MAG: hypothetical protein MUE74_11100, partial [Bacteroidales bacterium]|nr:hypothetical protein [Bacteroidales bacterium]
MKKIISNWIKLAAIGVLLLTSSQLKSQVEAFSLSVQNLVQTASNRLEFDVYLLDTDPGQTFELASMQLGFLFNSLIYTGGSVSVSYDNTGSGL